MNHVVTYWDLLWIGVGLIVGNIAWTIVKDLWTLFHWKSLAFRVVKSVWKHRAKHSKAVEE